MSATDLPSEYHVYPVSFSKINTYNLCKLKFYYTYIKKPAVKKTPIEHVKTKVGTFIHSVMEYMVQYPKSDFSLVWAQKLRVNGMLNVELEKAQEYREAVEIMLSKLHNVINMYNLHTFPEYRLNDEKKFIGVVDFVGISQTGTTGIIIDYKTYNKNEDNFEAVKLQTALYSYLLFKKIDSLQKIHAGCMYIPDKEVHLEKIDRESNFKNLEETYNSFIQKIPPYIPKDIPQPTKNDYCVFCYYTHLCPLFNSNTPK